MEQHKLTSKVPLIDESASFVYHLFMLESSVPVNKTEGHTQRPKMAMAAVKKGLAMGPSGLVGARSLLFWTNHLSVMGAVRWRSWLSHLSNTQKVPGSSPGRIIIFVYMTNLHLFVLLPRHPLCSASHVSVAAGRSSAQLCSAPTLCCFPRRTCLP